ncbi:MAG: DUF938 domain-containing protein [Kiloniellales bacterium]|nr:DUF938 domain-containing protein [Kiloniellales bacterium]
MKQTAAASERNSGPILEALAPLLPAPKHSRGCILEVASGPGLHVVAFAEARPDLDWQPSDPDPEARASIAAWIADSGLANVRQPLDLDVTRPDWPDQAGGPADKFDGLVTINLLHVAPWAACEGLMAGAARLLAPGAFLFVYGPFMRDGQHNSEGNRQFDRSLRARDPALGLRDVNDVAACAAQHGFSLDETIEMPANNRSLVFRLG